MLWQEMWLKHLQFASARLEALAWHSVSVVKSPFHTGPICQVCTGSFCLVFLVVAVLVGGTEEEGPTIGSPDPIELLQLGCDEVSEAVVATERSSSYLVSYGMGSDGGVG